MQCNLMNFDDRTRVVHDVTNRPVIIKIGETATCDLPDTVIELLTRGMQHGDPLVLVKEVPEHPPEIAELMSLLTNLNTDPYDDILRRTSDLLGKENIGGPRPSREELRFRLRNCAAALASSDPDTLLEISLQLNKASEDRKKLSVEDDVDPDELDRELAEQKVAERAKAEGRPLTQRDKMDAALGIGIGADTSELASALHDKSGDDAFPADQARPERPSKPRAKPRKPAKDRSTSSADKPAGITRIRA
jgi:hypothetical protein